MAISTADDLFLDELRDIYSAEKQAVRIYPRLAKAVASPDLEEALRTHLEETKGQVERLDRVFEILEKRSSGKTCEGMKGVLEESAEALEEIEEEGPVRDVALIAAAQRAEHYEIAAYGTVVSLAQAMGQEEIAQLLSETLAEEKQTDQKLTEISKTVNEQALAEGSEEEEVEDEEDDEEVGQAPKRGSAKKTTASNRKSAANR
jgi:ferritin-like metal-binding protein YciE